MKLFRTRDPLTVRRPSLMRTGVAVLAAGALTSLAACGGGSDGGSASASETDTVTLALDADAAPNGYDPLLYSQGQFTFFSSMYDALFVTAPDGTVTPSLATDFSNNADNTQTTLTIADGVTFTDGKPLDSAVVKANLDRRSDPDLEAYGSLAPGQASEITDVSAPHPKTVVITWKAPQATPQNNRGDTAGVIVGPDGLADPTSLETTPDGSGAYTLNTDETTRASTYSLEKSDDARDPEDWAYDTIVFKVITDDQAR